MIGVEQVKEALPVESKAYKESTSETLDIVSLKSLVKVLSPTKSFFEGKTERSKVSLLAKKKTGLLANSYPVPEVATPEAIEEELIETSA